MSSELRGTARGMMVSVKGEARISIYPDDETKRNLFDYDGKRVVVRLENLAEVLPPTDTILSNIEDRLEKLLVEVREMRAPKQEELPIAEVAE